jgi:hypothetical protein
MPGFDRRGPAGTGPMTGWGRGFCGSYGGRGGRRAFGARFGRGGRGMRWRQGFQASGPPQWGWKNPWQEGRHRGVQEAEYQPPYSREEEVAMLREQPVALKSELAARRES